MPHKHPEHPPSKHLNQTLRTGDLQSLKTALATLQASPPPSTHTPPPTPLHTLLTTHRAPHDETPLHHLLSHNPNPHALLTHLLTHGADPNARSEGTQATAPLHVAARRNDAEAIEILVRAGARVDIERRGGLTPLMIAAAGANVHAVDALLRARANVTARDGRGDSALHFAARGGGEDSVRRLLAAGADVDHRGWAGRTPLHVAAGRAGDGVVRVLLGAGAAVGVVDDGGMTAAHVAAGAGAVRVFRRVVEAAGAMGIAAIWDGDVGGLGVLHHAVATGGLEAVRGVVAAVVERARGRDVEWGVRVLGSVDRRGWSALWLAEARGDVVMAGVVREAVCELRGLAPVVDSRVCGVFGDAVECGLSEEARWNAGGMGVEGIGKAGEEVVEVAGGKTVEGKVADVEGDI